MMFGLEIDQVVCPLGLVAKAGVWYLAWQIHHTKLHFQPVSELVSVISTGLPFEDPAGFDLEAAWLDNLADWEAGRALYPVEALAEPHAVAELRRRGFTVLPRQESQPAPAGRARVEVAFSSLEAACQNLMGLGRSIEVLSPAPLRLVMIDYARQILQIYSAA
jgi:predicted DNA-binding transcriptional regulator YafY